MTEKRRCDICNLDVSKTNWSKHIKTKKTLRCCTRTKRSDI